MEINRKKMLAFYSQFISARSLCFDVGANIGNRTGIFLELGAYVVAVEPQLACVQALNKTFGHADRFTLVTKALGSVEGEAEMLIATESTVSSMNPEWIKKARENGRFAKCQWPTKVKVPVTTLDRLILEYGCPDFCKIDVEGYEVEVLKGLSFPIQAVSFEFTQESIENGFTCMDLLSRNGRYQFNYSLSESMIFGLRTWVDAKQMRTVLKGLKGRRFAGDIYAKIN